MTGFQEVSRDNPRKTLLGEASYTSQMGIGCLASLGSRLQSGKD
jgi:hypothetical protein